ncbi:MULTISPECIES: LysR family transcriptional regulator [Shewanella]|uniref:LysR family transcriptional regulator n=1 Tax=Shewanella TaxID=22 RepID=UPI0002F94030|nr:MULTISPECIES: LysR family transcriptional regulator [Shewanella]MDV5247111.1 LysR family transcriptional regulator [Shewanella xiamenensis]PWH02545.1 LysR family transcriptional regulator [Shewanella xiamenensis]
MHISNMDGLDILSLKILVSLYENKSATYVSKALDIPAPKISRSLKNLREVFGDELFIRKKYGLFPNEFVTHLYPIAKQTIECTEKFQKVRAANVNHVKTHVEIAAPGLIAYAFPKALMQAIKEEQKSIHINITPWSLHTTQDIINGDTTLGICCNKSTADVAAYGDKLQTTTLQRMGKVYLIASRNHPIFKREITLETIAEYPYVNTDLGNPSTRLSPYQEFCIKNGIKLNTEITITSISSLFEYLGESQTISLLPYRVVYEMVAEIPELHTCQLSQLEAERLYADTEAPTIFLVQKNQPNRTSEELVWLSEQIKKIVDSII